MKLFKKWNGVSALTLLAIAGGLRTTFPALNPGNRTSQVKLESLSMTAKPTDRSDSNNTEDFRLCFQIDQKHRDSNKVRESEPSGNVFIERRGN